MKRLQFFLIILAISLAACSATEQRGTIAELRMVEIEIENEPIEGGLEKAMASYEQFLQEAAASSLAPEAIRRLADLKVEKEYGLRAEAGRNGGESSAKNPLPAHHPAAIVGGAGSLLQSLPVVSETDAEFEQRTAGMQADASLAVGGFDPTADDLERAGAVEAVELYRKLLSEYPQYERNDQVLYQLSRAYEELGRIEEAMAVMNQLVQAQPQSRYIDEIQFRRAEYFFTHRSYLDAEEAYGDIVAIGESSSYYLLALYKLGWTYYKQELYEEALQRFVALLDLKHAQGYDFDRTEDDLAGKRVQDTFRVVSLSLSYLGGSAAAADYFSRQGNRSYEDHIHRHLAEYYFSKRRYSDAVATYSVFLEGNPYHRKAPLFQMRVVEINTAGGFPSLVIEAKQAYATRYGLTAGYWQYFDPAERPEVLADLKTNLTDLANHYHALYRNPKHKDEQRANFSAATHWYRQFLVSFPQAGESPAINYQLADLLLEDGDFAAAAVEYEQVAYAYPAHDQSAKGGYAAVYAYRQQLSRSPEQMRDPAKYEVVRSSLRFAETFPKHEKAALILGAAADDLYALREYERAVVAGQTLLAGFPDSEIEIRRSAWLVVAHSCYELEVFDEAETAYLNLLELLADDDKTAAELVDNLAAAIYRQGEEASLIGNFRAASEHFLRVSSAAPSSQIRPTAEYDAAAALIQLEEWSRAASVLNGFRDHFPDHELQHEVTKKIAFVYREDGQYAEAAREFERIAAESEGAELRRDALLVAAELYEKVPDVQQALLVYQRYVSLFPHPFEIQIETRNKLAGILKQQEKRAAYLTQLRKIVDLEASAAAERTDRTRYLASAAALVLAELDYERFLAIDLVEPFAVNLQKKKQLMKTATTQFNRLVDYQIGEYTAAATYYLAEIYGHFSQALIDSERPAGMSAMELEEYELVLEEQAYPFEEQAISVHESNLELLALGIYNPWIEKSLARLAEFVPARYAKPVAETMLLTSPTTFSFVIEGTHPVSASDSQVAAVETISEPSQQPIESVVGVSATGGQTAAMIGNGAVGPGEDAPADGQTAGTDAGSAAAHQTATFAGWRGGR